MACNFKSALAENYDFNNNTSQELTHVYFMHDKSLQSVNLFKKKSTTSVNATLKDKL